MRSKTKVFMFLLLLLFISIQCFAQIRSINAEIGEKAGSRLQYTLIAPVIHTKDYLSSSRSDRDKSLYLSHLKSSAHFIALDINVDEPKLEVLIKIKNNSEIDLALIENTTNINGLDYDYLIGRVNLKDLKEVAEMDDVIFIEPSYKTNIELNQSAADIQANEVWSCGSGGILDCITGRNVTIGIIDGKPNRDHITFLDEGGNSRFQQYDNTNPSAHGSHVAGIAGGRGDENAFNRGIAYGSDLRWFPLGTTDDILASVQELISLANGDPLVINFSAGSTFGPRDGSTILDEALGELIQGNVIFVKSAGNNSSTTGRFNHFEGNVPSQAGDFIEFEFQLQHDTVTAIEIWHDSQFNVQVSDANLTSLTWSEMIDFGTIFPFDDYPGNTNDYIQITNSENGFGVIYIEYGSSDNFFVPGTYHIRLYPNDNNGGHFDAYHNNLNRYGGFLAGDNYQTITNPGYCPKVITVAASMKGDFGGVWAPYSSLGPSRTDEPNEVSKPDITAPGGSHDENTAKIWSASNESNDDWKGFVGTSMAAPHVTGSIALLMENYPQLNADQVKAILQNSASAIPNGNWQGNNTLTGEEQKYWGAGKLDILAAYQSMAGFDYSPLPGNISVNFNEAYNPELAGLPIEPVVSDWNEPGYYKQKLSNGAIFHDEEAFWLGEGIWEKWLEINDVNSIVGLPVSSEQPDVNNNNYTNVYFEYGKIYWDDPEAIVCTFNVEFTTNQQSGEVPLTVEFTDQSTATNSSVIGWLWDFGDGIFSSEQHPAHTYYSAGNFDVTLTIYDHLHGFSMTKSNYISTEMNIVESEIEQIEYFINEDPGYGNATQLTVSPSPVIENLIFSIDISSLNNGFNHLYVRARGDENVWSLTNVKSFYVEPAFALPQNIVKAEYFIDTDPGYGNATAIPVAASPDITNIGFVAEVDDLPMGFHHLYVRAQDVHGVWSLTNVKSFYADPAFAVPQQIVQAEYFLDTDPGLGNGINIPVTPSHEITNLNFMVDITDLPMGFHHLYVRTKDENEVWGLTNVKSFYVEPAFALPQNIVKAEYFIDTDPGYGNATAIPVVASADITNIGFVAGIGDLPMGFHHLYVRAQDVHGVWSLTNVKSFYAEPAFAVPQQIVQAEYFLDTDPGLGNGINISVSPSHEITNLDFMVDITDLPMGFHHLYVRTKDENKVWSLTNVKSFYKELIYTSPQNIVKAEFFFNIDPGMGNGTELALTPSPDLSGLVFIADVLPFPLLENILYVRAMDENGKWSLTNVHTFVVGCADVVVDFDAEGCATMPTAFVDNSINVHPLSEYRWDFGDGTPELITGVGNVLHTYTGVGDYDVRLIIVSREECSDTLVKSIVINEPPTVYAGADQTICKGNAVTLNANYTYGTLSWNHNVTNGVAFVPTETTIYTASVESSFGCGPVSDQVVITVIPLPTAFAGNNATGCANENFAISNASANNYTSLSWQAANGNGYFDNGNQLNTVYHPAASDPATVTLCLSAAPLSPCTVAAEDCFNLLLTQPPSVSIQSPADGSVICASTVVGLIATVQHSSTVQWSTTGDGVFANATQSNTSYYPGSLDITNGQLTLCLGAQPLNGCTLAATDCITLIIQADPEITLDADFWLDCSDYNFVAKQWFPYQMSATVENAASFEWSTEGDGYFDNPSNLQANYHLGNSDILNGEVVLTLSASGPDQCNLVVSEPCVLNIPRQLIPISQAGWRGISSYIDKSDKTVPEVLAPVANGLAIIMDEANKTYNPATGINNIGNWGAVGYRANFTNPQVCLPVYGVPVSDQTFEIVNSTTFLPVLTDIPVAIADLFNGHLNKIQQIYDWSTFKTWTPANAGFSELKPGYAYSLVNNSEFTIEFPPFSWEPPLSQVSINGKIINEANGNPVGNIEVLVSGESSVLTNAEGIYSAIVPLAWSGTITPAKAEWIFSPSSKSFENVLVNIYDQDFTGISTSCDPGWEFIVTGSYHTISIPLESNPNIFGEPLQADDWIGVFYLDDNGTEQCGGNAQWTDAPGLVIMAYEDDPATAEKDGFAIGEIIQWKIYSCSTQETYNAVATYDPYMPDQGIFANWGFSSLVSLNCQLCQELTWLENWNSVSLYVEPSNPDVETLFAPMVNDLIIMRNLNSIYWPELSINTIGDWDIESGYVMKMIAASSGASICGLPVSGSSLTLSASENTWHYLPVLSSCPVDVNQMFWQEIDNIVIVKDLIGCKVWWPQMEVYSLVELFPGRAYEIKLSGDVTFSYPECTKATTKNSHKVSNVMDSDFGEIKFTPFTHTIAFPAQVLQNLPANSRIGVFNNEGEIFGLSNEVDKNAFAVVVNGDDPSTSEVDGFEEGAMMYFRIIESTSGADAGIMVDYDNKLPNTGYFTNHGLSAIANIELTGFEDFESSSLLVNIHPNPSTGIFNVSLDRVNPVDCEVFDIHGGSILKLKNQANHLSIDLSSYPKGIYYLKLTQGELQAIRKLVLQ